MASIYSISKKLMELFNIIEDNDGEITPGLEEDLTITNDSLKEKCDEYINAISLIKGDVATIKDEAKRLSTLKKSKETTIERLRKSLLVATQQFGDVNDKGVARIKTTFHSLSIRKLSTLIVNEILLKNVIERFINRYLFKSFIGTIDEEESIDDIIESCNTAIGSDDFEENNTEDKITELDFEEIVANISFNFALADITTTEGKNLIKALCAYTKNIQYSPYIDKDALKTYVSTNYDTKIASIEQKDSILIK